MFSSGMDNDGIVGISQLVPSGVLLVDKNNDVVWADESAREMFGTDDGEYDKLSISSGNTDELEDSEDPDGAPYLEVVQAGDTVRNFRCTVEFGGKSYPVTADAVPVGSNGDISYVALAVDERETPQVPEVNRFGRNRTESSHAPTESLERMEDAFYSLNRAFEFTYLNGKAEELLQSSEEELLGVSVWKAFPEAKQAPVWEAFQEARETQESSRVEFYYDPLDMWIEGDIYPSDTGFSVYFRDITERKERIRELEMYETVVETVDDGVCVMDEEGNFVMVNDGYAEMTGYSKEKLLGKPGTKVVSEEVADEAAEVKQELKQGDRETAEIEAEVETADGDTFIGRAKFTGVETENNEFLSVGVVRDVTESKRRRQELRKQRRRYRTLVHNIPNGATALFDSNLEYVVVGGRTIPEMQEPSEIEGKPIQDVLPQEVAETALPNYRATLSGEKKEFTIENEGEVRKVHTVPVTDEDGNVVSGIAISQDITARRHRRQELLKQRKQMGVLNSIDTLIQNISKEAVKESEEDDVFDLVLGYLNGSDYYQGAWIGKVEDGVIKRTVEGMNEGELPMESPVEQDDSPDLAVQAARTGAPVSSDLSVTTYSGGDRPDSMSAASVPLTYKEESYGVLTLYSRRESAFTENEKKSLKRLGSIIGHAVKSAHRQTALRKSERLYRKLAENLPNGAVILVDDSLTVQVIAGELVDRLQTDATELRGKKITEADVIPDEKLRRVDEGLGTALEGDYHSFDLELEGKVINVHTLPVEDTDGAMALAQDITPRVERKRQLEQERERLEFLVRLLRHNLLNSLNVVKARAEKLDGRVDYEVSPHLETARGRTEGMINLVETIRTLTETTVRDKEHMLKPVSLDDVLTQQVSSAESAYPDAEITVGTFPSVEVLADELLGEALENVIHNAVQHNDNDTPEVTVEATEDNETVTVSVRDNGPGIPNDVREWIQSGEGLEFKEPGTGFGLYLTREIIESYGGDLDISNVESGGAAVRITLRRAN